MTKKENETQSWIEAVALRANVDAATAERALESLQVRPAPHLPRPRTLRLHEVKFKGHKSKDGSDTPIDFSWPLDKGVHCLASDGNLVGKSSVLRSILWGLRGEPGSLQADVRAWIRDVHLAFSIDDVRHVVSFLNESGTVRGAVHRGRGKAPIATFANETEFATCMDEIMREALGLDRIPSWQSHAGSRDGRIVTHGWPAYSSALVIAEAAHKVLLGETDQAGLPGRLLQMFIGLPWASTTATAKSKVKELSQRIGNVARRRTEDAAVRSTEEEALRSRIATLRDALGKLPDDAPALSATKEAFLRLSAAQEAMLDAARHVERATADLAAARDHRVEDKGRLQDAEESRLARRFFDALDPSCCPRCDSAIGSEQRRREKNDHACAICASPLSLKDDDEAVFAVLRDAARASAEAEDVAKKRRDEAAATLEERETALSAARSAHESARKTVESLGERRRLEIDLARLEGALEERVRTREAVEAGDGQDDALTLAVAKAADAEADARAKAAADDLFALLDDEVCRLAQGFGMSSLSAVKLDRAGRLSVTKGGQRAWFSSLTAGERLRLRVATVAGLLRVAKEHGVGRHPGVLLLDSPGSEEVRRDDAAELVRELVRVCEEVGEFQIIVTTARPDIVKQVLPLDRLRLVARGAYAW